VPRSRGAAKAAHGAGEQRLQGYRSKRDFSATPEPAPAVAEPAGGRFVIHEHHARRLHWDLRLERDGVLASWAVPKGLPAAPGENRFAAATEDHPLEYLDFQGEIPAGEYGAGAISIWDSGTYETLKWEPRKVEVALHGKRVDARYALFPIDSEEPAKDWMIHRMDPPEDTGAEPMPTHIVPMLARAGELPKDESGWAFELKWDGVRAIAYSSPGSLRVESRNLNDITDTYPDIARAGRALGSHSAILDGEIVAFDESGLPSFAALSHRMHASSRSQATRLSKQTPVTYVIFDLLWLDGHPLMDLPYSARRERLESLKLDGDGFQTPEHVIGHGAGLLAMCAERGLEGVVAKALGSPYQPGLRPRSWVKVKTFARQEFVIGGWVPGNGRRREHIGSLLLGVGEDDGLRYVGRVGSGLGEDELNRLAQLLAPLTRASSPFTSGAKPPKQSVFCEPRLVAEVRFAHWTRAGSLRHPSYLGLREDKDPKDVVREDTAAAPPEHAGAQGALAAADLTGKSAKVSIEGRELSLSNLPKVLYPDSSFTKRDLVGYYAQIAPAILPHLAGRAITLTRWPDGVDGKSFFQKQAPAHRPAWVATAPIATSSRTIDYIEAGDLATLIWLANSAAIELHAPLARASAPEHPTTLVFDLDPGAPASIVECCQVAELLAGMFENLGLVSCAKTSGAKGLQVYVPLNGPDVTFDDTKPFAKAVAEMLADAEPELIVSNMKRERRKGRVLIDWSQNDRNKTTVCVYSLRATAAPTVSTPVSWEEVRAVSGGEDPASLSFLAHEVLARVARTGDLFAPVLTQVQELPRL
jgi:bifunctional non-homologous end joining protein LigD